MTTKEVLARDIKGNIKSIPVKDMTFRISVYGATILRNKVLLVPQWDGYDIPGGGIEVGETTEEALVREVFEETGLDVKPIMDKPIYVMHDFFIHPTNGKYYHYLLLYYACELIGGNISTENFEDDEKEYAKAAKWIDIKSINKLKFYNPADNLSIISSAKEIIRNR